MLHEIQLIPFGYHVTSKGDFLLDEEALKLVVSTFDAQVNDLVVDYEHQTLSGKEAPAAGWIKKLMNRGRQGLWGLVDWTDRARAYLGRNEYHYLSPVFLKRQSDNRVVRLVNAGLTNAPEIDGMEALSVNKSGFGMTVQTSGALAASLSESKVFVDETQRRINQQMGISEEVWQKYGG